MSPALLRQVVQNGVSTLTNAAITRAIIQREASIVSMSASFLGSIIGQEAGGAIADKLARISAPQPKNAGIHEVAKKAVHKKVVSNTTASNHAQNYHQSTARMLKKLGVQDDVFDASIDFTNPLTIKKAKPYIGELNAQQKRMPIVKSDFRQAIINHFSDSKNWADESLDPFDLELLQVAEELSIGGEEWIERSAKSYRLANFENEAGINTIMGHYQSGVANS